MGYFSISGGSLSNDPLYDPGSSSCATQPGYTSTNFMENELKRLQGTRRHLQRFVSTKQQSQVSAFNFPLASAGELSQTIHCPAAVNNYTVVKNVFHIQSRSQINSGSDKPGRDNIITTALFIKHYEKPISILLRNLATYSNCMPYITIKEIYTLWSEF